VVTTRLGCKGLTNNAAVINRIWRLLPNGGPQLPHLRDHLRAAQWCASVHAICDASSPRTGRTTCRATSLVTAHPRALEHAAATAIDLDKSWWPGPDPFWPHGLGDATQCHFSAQAGVDADRPRVGPFLTSRQSDTGSTSAAWIRPLDRGHPQHRRVHPRHCQLPCRQRLLQPVQRRGHLIGAQR